LEDWLDGVFVFPELIADDTETKEDLLLTNAFQCGVENYYMTDKLLGTGTYGRVYKACEKKTNNCRDYVTKIMKLDNDADRRAFQSEAEIAALFSKWGIGPRVYGANICGDVGVLYMQRLEPLEGITVSMEQFAEFFLRINNAHHRGYWFQDLYVRNVMVEPGTNRLMPIDYGMVSKFDRPVPPVLRLTDWMGLMLGDATFDYNPDNTLRLEGRVPFKQFTTSADRTFAIGWKVTQKTERGYPKDNVLTYLGMYYYAAARGWSKRTDDPIYTAFNTRVDYKKRLYPTKRGLLTESSDDYNRGVWEAFRGYLSSQ